MYKTDRMSLDGYKPRRFHAPLFVAPPRAEPAPRPLGPQLVFAFLCGFALAAVVLLVVL